jgi:hypothetical protein
MPEGGPRSQLGVRTAGVGCRRPLLGRFVQGGTEISNLVSSRGESRKPDRRDRLVSPRNLLAKLNSQTLPGLRSFQNSAVSADIVGGVPAAAITGQELPSAQRTGATS